MKGTDFYALTRKVKAMELDELMLAVKAHGGSFTFEDQDAAPRIMVNMDNIGPIDVTITKVSIKNSRHMSILSIFGLSDCFYGEKEIYFNDIAVGHASYITEAIPATNEVDDVKTTTSGDLDVDSEIMYALTADLYPRMSAKGTDFKDSYLKLRHEAEKLTKRHAHTDWDERDFIIEMEEASDKIAEHLKLPASPEKEFYALVSCARCDEIATERDWPSMNTIAPLTHEEAQALMNQQLDQEIKEATEKGYSEDDIEIDRWKDSARFVNDTGDSWNEVYWEIFKIKMP